MGVFRVAESISAIKNENFKAKNILMMFLLKITLLRNFGMPLWDFGAKVQFFYFFDLILLSPGGFEDQKIRKKLHDLSDF